MYKVFINDRAIVLTDNYDDYQSSYDTLFIHFASRPALYESVEVLRESDVVNKLCVFTDNLEEVWDDFCNNYNTIRAAGGVVINDNKVLMILKNGYWDLPKGKIEGAESTEDAAKREVTEECGLKNLTITKELDTTYYLFQDNGNTTLKKTQWYEMSSDAEGPLKGDEKEGITEVKWMDAGTWAIEKNKSYPSVVKMLDLFF